MPAPLLGMLIKRAIVAVVGGTVLLIGVALLVLPGPAFLVIPLGLAILATEFVWARRWLRRAKGMVDRRKASRTTRAFGLTLRRRWERWRQWARDFVGFDREAGSKNSSPPATPPTQRGSGTANRVDPGGGEEVEKSPPGQERRLNP